MSPRENWLPEVVGDVVVSIATTEVTMGTSDVTGEVTVGALLTEEVRVTGVVTELVIVEGRLVTVETGLVGMGDILLVVIATELVTVVSVLVTLVWLKQKIEHD